ncbi:hypothetical protein [Micromonospora carbonacea]|uniref:hypothetical protein n=1 Tax=Micromonospora carbonacea TaxID=47853 RepID=UPI003D75F223
MTVNASYRAAWVPDDDPNRPWDEASALAVEWIEAEARQRGQRVVLVTNTRDVYISGSPLSRYSWPNTHTSPRSGWSGSRGVPVLSYVPHEKELDFATDLAHGSALCIVETVNSPVGGWAASVGALNLISGVPSSLDPKLAEHLDTLAFYGNNGYPRGFDRDRAQNVLDDIQRDGHLDRGLIVSALAAHRISVNGRVNIGKMIDAMHGGRSRRR